MIKGKEIVNVWYDELTNTEFDKRYNWCLENIGPKHTLEQEGLWMDRCLPEWQYQRYQIRIKEDTHATMFVLKWQP